MHNIINETSNIEVLAIRTVTAIIRNGFKPNHPFSWSLEIAQGYNKKIGQKEYDRLMDFLVGNEWFHLRSNGDYFVTEWGVCEALGIER